jgi:hypothetical protein
MSIDQAVIKFETLLRDVDKIIPAVLKDGSIGYHNYIVRKNESGLWDLIQIGKKIKNNIASFYLKSSALMAAQQHRCNRIMELSRTKDLDQRYWYSYTDSINFKERYKRTKDEFKRDVFLWRYEQAKVRSEYYKEEITGAFTYLFR